MIDRIAYGTVVDFIDFCAFPKLWMWVFNGADSFVCIGAAILVIYYIKDLASSSKSQNGEAVSASDSEKSTLGDGFGNGDNADNADTAASDNGLTEKNNSEGEEK